jgi:dTDP-4-dehydrorhamnose 3,5-epimerase-like enzyme
MKIQQRDNPGLLLVPKKHGGQRGFFSEVFRADVFADLLQDEVAIQLLWLGG